jgi:phosphate starvation-inducible membrane PsiE
MSISVIIIAITRIITFVIVHHANIVIVMKSSKIIALITNVMVIVKSDDSEILYS